MIDCAVGEKKKANPTIHTTPEMPDKVLILLNLNTLFREDNDYSKELKRALESEGFQ